MRVRADWLLVSVAVLAAALTSACGDDDDDKNSGSGGGSSGGAASGSGGSGEQNVTCTPSDKGDCTNDNDCPKVESGEIRSASQSCGLSCLQNSDPGTCAVTCIVMQTQASQACSICYATLVQCASQKCLGQCAADPTSAACDQCQIDQGCRGDFDTCSGLTTATK